MTGIYKSVINALAPQLMKSVLVFQNTDYNDRNRYSPTTSEKQLIMDLTHTYRSPTIWAKLPTEHELSNSHGRI